MTTLDREQLLQLLVRDLEHALQELRQLRDFAERVAEAVLLALARHEERPHAVTPEFGKERNG